MLYCRWWDINKKYIQGIIKYKFSDEMYYPYYEENANSFPKPEIYKMAHATKLIIERCRHITIWIQFEICIYETFGRGPSFQCDACASVRCQMRLYILVGGDEQELCAYMKIACLFGFLFPSPCLEKRLHGAPLERLIPGTRPETYSS